MIHRRWLIIAGLFITQFSFSNQNESVESLFNLTLEELLSFTITSRRYEESYRDTNRPLSVISSSDMQNNLLEDIYDLAYLVPNFSFRKNFGKRQERPVMRSISSINGEPPVGILIDGVSVSNISTTYSLTGVQHIEVLRGPEAALYGRSTFGGAINFVTKRPEDKNDLSFKVSGGNFGHRQIDAGINLAVTPNLFLGVGGKANENDPLIKNSLGSGGGGYAAEKNEHINLALRWLPSKQLEFFYRGYDHQDDTGHMPLYLQNASSNNCFLQTAIQYFCGKIETPKQVGFSNGIFPWELGFEKTNERHHAETQFRNEKLQFKFIYSQSDVVINDTYDFDFYELDSTFANDTIHIDEQTFEIFANIKWPALRLMIGSSFFEQEDWRISDLFFLQGTNLVEDLGNPHIQNVDNKAVFSSIDIDLKNNFALDIDLRYSKDSIDYRNELPGQLEQGEDSWSDFSPRINLSRRFENNWLTYFSVAKGFKPGGFNISLNEIDYFDENERDRILAFLAYDDEKLITYNLGFKGELTNTYASINLFLNYWDDLQLTQSLSYIDGTENMRRVSTIVNGGAATTWGAEVEFDTQLSNQLNGKFTFGYTESNIKNSETSAQEDLTGNPSIDGKEIPNAPELNGFAGIYYKKNIAENLNLKANVNLAYESRRFVAEHNLATIGSTTKLNANVAIAKGNLQLSLWGKNLTDDNAPESVARFGDAATFFARRAFGISLAEPRRYGISLSHILE